MKKEKGITLVSLVIYVVVMIMVIGVMNSIITSFYNNTDVLKGNVQEVVEFNKFNIYFLKEIKGNGKKVDRVEENYILFLSGNSFSIAENAVYYNNIKICNGVKNLRFELEQDTEDAEGEYSIIRVNLSFENFDKTIRYKFEEIY